MWDVIHSPPLWRRLISSLWLLSTVGVIALISGVVISVLVENYGLFNRFGAIACVVGGLLMIRKKLRLSSKSEDYYEYFRDVHEPLDPGLGKAQFSELGHELTDKTAQRVGAALIAVGTLVWAWGDLIVASII